MAKLTKTKKLAILVTALVVLIGGAAFAYWTAGGSGTGTADDRHQRPDHGRADQHGDRDGPG